MKPLPVQTPDTSGASESAAPAHPEVVAPSASRVSVANRRTSQGVVQSLYPLLLLGSTAVAALFCFLYITKPVINAPQAVMPPAVPIIPSAAVIEAAPAPAAPTAPTPVPEVEPTSLPIPAFEETNLRIQHILSAEAPGGHKIKLDLSVPVLYQSRNLRWTASEVATARELLTRLGDYQEESQILRAKGAELLDSWNALVSRSIPSDQLRADSPTLPANQSDAADAPRPAGLDTSNLIKLEPAGK